MTTNREVGQERITLVLPAAFWSDHRSRDLVTYPVEETPTSKGVRVTLTRVDAGELLSEATHYAECGIRDFGVGMLGIISSARATVKRLRDAGVDEWEIAESGFDEIRRRNELGRTNWSAASLASLAEWDAVEYEVEA